MKKFIYIITLLLVSLTSCEEVVDVDLETAQERLVIEAMIKWESGTNGNDQTIKLSRTSSFYNNEILKATGASVKITNISSSETFLFTETDLGLYTTTTFNPVLNDTYTLEVIFNGETYTASGVLFEAPEILEITQSKEDGFYPEENEVNIFFQDFVNQEDYYRIEFIHSRPIDVDVIEELNRESFTYDSNFEEDNLLSDYYENEDLLSNDVVDITLYKISKQFYNFLYVLEEQADAGFGPFSSPPVNVKGNIVNSTQENHYPYGYFELNQISTATYTLE